MTHQIRQHDLLLSYPFESMDPFLRLLKESASDPAVVSIKITIYRLAKRPSWWTICARRRKTARM